MSSRATRQLAQLWQLPLLLFSLVLFALAGYLFVNASPGLTARRRIEIARLYIEHDRPDAALEQLNRLLIGEHLDQTNEASVHLLIGAALEAGQKQRRISIPANHLRIIEQTQLALALGAKPSGETSRRLGDSLLALGRPTEAVGQYRQSIVLDPVRALPMRKMIIEAQQDADARLKAIDEYLDAKETTDAERAWGLGEKSQILADRGDFVAARALIADALRLDPDPLAQAQANYRMGYCAWKLGKTEEAQKLLKLAREQFHEQHPLDADAAYALARIAQEKDDLKEACALYQVVLKNPDSRCALGARLGQAVCLINTGQEESGLICMRQLVGLLRVEAAPPGVREQTASAIARTSEILIGKMNYSAALEALELEKTLGCFEPTYFSRLATASQKRAEQVETTLADVTPTERLRRSEVIRDLLNKAADASLAASRNALAAGDKDYSKSFIAALDLYQRAGNERAAISAMELFICERGTDAIAPDVMLRLGQSYEHGAAPDKAIAVYQQLQDRFANTPAGERSGLLLAQAYIAQGPAGYLSAEKVLTRIAAPENRAAVTGEQRKKESLELAQLLYRTERFDEAIARLATDPSPVAMFIVADSYRKSALKMESKIAATRSSELTATAASRKDRLTNARQMYDRLIDFYRSNPPTDETARQYEKQSHFYRADCVFELANYQEAIGLYEQAAARYQQDATALAAYVQIVNSYCALGKMDEARTANEKAKMLLRRLPAEAFNDGGFTMPRAYWEQWLKWTSTAGAW